MATLPPAALADYADAAAAPPPPPDDYDSMLNYPSEHRNQLTNYIINELQSQNISSRLVKPAVAMVFGMSEAYNPLVASHPFSSGAGGQKGALGALESAPAGNHSLGAMLNASAPLPPRPYLGDVFFSFHNIYWPFHCITCLIICTLGIFANVTNIIVLTRPNMKSAVNVILCAMAFSDLIVNVSNIPYLVHELGEQNYSFGWAIYTLFHAHTTVTAHTISIWLTCVLATWRYCVVCRSQSTNQRNWSVGLAYRVIVVVFIFVPIFCIPNYLSFAILQETTEGNTTFHKVGFSQLADNSQFIKTFHFWIFSVLTKLVPCVLLTFFTTALIRKLLSARERRLRLASHANNVTKNQAENGLAPAREAPLQNGERERKLSVGAPDAAPAGHRQANGLLGVPDARRQTDAEATSDVTTFNGPSENSPLSRSDNSISPGELAASLARRPARNSPTGESRADRNGLPVDEASDGRGGGAEQDARNEVGGRVSANSHHREPVAASLQHSNSSSAATDVDTTQVCSDLNSSNEDNAELQTSARNRAQQPVILSQLIVESCPTKSGSNNRTVSKASKIYAQSGPQSGAGAAAADKWNLRPNGSAVGAAGLEPKSASTGGSTTFLGLYACTTDDNTGGVRQQLVQPVSGSASQGNLASPAQHPPSLSRADTAERRLSGEPTAKPAGGQGGAGQGGKRLRSVGSTTLAPFQMVKLQASQRQLTQNETTTRLLIAVMIVFLICESPAGILSVLCAILGQEFFDNVYQPMGILTDLLALINSSVNFILYCFMSTQFRVTFYRVVLHCPAPNAKQVQQQVHHQQQQQHVQHQATTAATTRPQSNNGNPKQPKPTRHDY